MTVDRKKKVAARDAGLTLTKVVLEIFRLNGRLISVGDEMNSDLGLTSARWQVMGGIALTPYDLTVSSIARLMGLQRQSVQRLVDLLCADGLLMMAPNIHHKTAHIVKLTDAGREVYESAMLRQTKWANKLGVSLADHDLEKVLEFLRAFRLGLGDDGPTLLP